MSARMCVRVCVQVINHEQSCVVSFAVMTTTNTAEHQSGSSTPALTSTPVVTSTPVPLPLSLTFALALQLSLSHSRSRTYAFPLPILFVFSALALPSLPLFVQLAAYVNYLPFFFLAMLSLLRCSPIQLAVAIRTHTHAPTWERAHLVRLCGTAKCIIL